MLIFTLSLYASVVRGTIKPQDHLVTYQAEAEPLARALSDVSRQTGVTISAEGKLLPDIVAFDVTKVPLQEFLSKLAKVEYATLQKDSNGYFLKSNALEEKAQDQSYVATRTATLEKFAELVSKNPSAMTPGIGLQQQTSQADAEEVVKMLIDSGIGAMNPGDRWVFSNEPNHLQRPVPANYVSKMQAIEDKYKATGKYDITVQRPIISIREPFGANYRITMITNVKNGSPDTLCQFTFNTAVSYLKQLLIKPNRGNQAQSNENGHNQSGTADTFNAPSFCKKFNELASFSKPSQYQSMVDLDSFDPLTVDGDILLIHGEQNHVQTIVSLPDNLYDYFFNEAHPLPSDDISAAIAANDRIHVFDEKGWELIGMGNPTWQRKDRLNRTGVGNFYKQFVADSKATKREIEKYCALIDGRESLMTLSLEKLAHMAVGERQNFYYQIVLPLALLGSMNDIQIEAMNSGGNVQIAALSSDSLAFLNRCVYSSNVMPEGFISVPEKSAASKLSALCLPVHSPIIIGEITDVEPDGLPNTTTLSTYLQPIKTYTGTNDPDKKGNAQDDFHFITSGQVGTYLALLTIPELQSYLPKYSKLIYTSMPSESRIVVNFSKDKFDRLSDDFDVNPNFHPVVKVVDFQESNMPPDVKEAFQEAVELCKQITFVNGKMQEGKDLVPISLLLQQAFRVAPPNGKQP